MNNFGLISKKRLAKEIAKLYNDHTNPKCGKDEFLYDCGACSALNYLCYKLQIKPMHLNKMGGGTGEMLKK